MPAWDESTRTTDDISLDPATTALLIQGCQNDVISVGGVLESEGMAEHAIKQDMVANISGLAETFRQAGSAVVHIHFVAQEKAQPPTNSPLWDKVTRGDAMLRGSWGVKPHPGLEPHASDYVIEKTRTGVFANSGLDGLLRSLGTRNIVCTGVLTNYSVVMTAHDAQDLGYTVFAVADGACSKNDEWHEAALKYEMPWLGWTFPSCESVSDAIARHSGARAI